MAAVAKLLDSARLVTLVGAAGVGKTRLAIQVASAAFELHGEGVSLARLAAVDEPSLVAAAVAAAVGVREQPGRSMLAALISHLSSRRLLLILDNCEHVIGAAAGLAEALLCACPGLRILGTSRQALRIDGEAAWPVPPLSVPPVRQEWDADGLTAYEAVRLFVERALATDPTFVLTAVTAPPGSRLATGCWRPSATTPPTDWPLPRMPRIWATATPPTTRDLPNWPNPS